MNREERRQKRKQDTRKAAVILALLFAVIVLAVLGIIFGLSRFLKSGAPEEPKDTEVSAEPAVEPDISSEPAVPEEPEADPLQQQAEAYVAGMTLEDKVAQMFIITPEALTGYSGVTAAGDTTKEAYGRRPVGGLVYMAENLQDTQQTTEMLANMQVIATERTGLPAFLCVDEEGGTVARIAGNSAFGVSDVGKMSDIGATGDAQNAYHAGTVIGTYLKQLGFQVDFAPVADVLTNSDNTVIGSRSFGSEAGLVADMVASELAGLSDQGVYGVVKHFPGHGGTAEDSHEGAAVSEKTLEELKAEDLLPFQRAVDAGVSFVMVGHISLPNVTGDNTPASLSPFIITDVLRGQIGYNGIVVTDAMDMQAITAGYTADQAALAAVNAGADIILMPQDYETAYQALLSAVQSGAVSEERINESVTRIVKIKMQMMQ